MKEAGYKKEGGRGRHVQAAHDLRVEQPSEQRRRVQQPRDGWAVVDRRHGSVDAGRRQRRWAPGSRPLLSRPVSTRRWAAGRVRGPQPGGDPSGRGSHGSAPCPGTTWRSRERRSTTIRTATPISSSTTGSTAAPTGATPTCSSSTRSPTPSPRPVSA